uniref:Uncharacterized protein n=1 Tax=Babesia bovis TaxID=5865 RepID=A7AQX0_BABBO|eukprot:XP_001610507.1 hypothetical protein [Babesia bovis T2Bo]
MTDSVTACADLIAQRLRGMTKKVKPLSAVDLINVAGTADWKQLEKSLTARSAQPKRQHSTILDPGSKFASCLWAYLPPNAAEVNSDNTPQPVGDVVANNSSEISPSRKRACKSVNTPNRTLEHKSLVSVSDVLSRLFGKTNEKSQHFNFEQEPTELTLKHALDSLIRHEDGSTTNSQYSSTTLEECERFLSSCYGSFGSDVTLIDETSTTLAEEQLEDLMCTPLEVVRRKCEMFFERHGLVVKVRKLPAENAIRKTLPDSKQVLCYPAYHFVTRQYTHMFEQLMRARTFLDTRYNSCNESRNAKSPFSMVEPREEVINQIEALANDFTDPDFKGIFISVSTKAFVSPSEFGLVRRTKTVAWAVVELLESNRRDLKGLWVNPSLSASSATTLLSAMLPYTIMTSFMMSHPTADQLTQNKLFSVGLSAFDAFPRQALVLLTSPLRCGLVKHYEVDSDSTERVHEPDCDYCNVEDEPNHVDMGTSTDQCFCYQKANWNDLRRVIVGCTEGLMNMLLPRWRELIPHELMADLLDDLEHIVKPDSVMSQPIKTKEVATAIREAEYTGLTDIEIRVC